MSDPFKLTSDPELADLLRVLEQVIKLKIRTHVPAAIVTYDAARQRATVLVQQLAVVRLRGKQAPPPNTLYVQGKPPNLEAVLQPIQLTDVPVAWPRTQAGYVTFPLVAGDTGELHVSDRSLAAWLDAKAGGVPVDPKLALTHSLADSTFYPGLHSDKTPIAPPTDLTATVVEGAQIKLGRTATLAVALADPLITALDAFANATPAANDGGLAIHTAFKTAWLTAKPLVAALKARAE